MAASSSTAFVIVSGPRWSEESFNPPNTEAIAKRRRARKVGEKAQALAKAYVASSCAGAHGIHVIPAGSTITIKDITTLLEEAIADGFCGECGKQGMIWKHMQSCVYRTARDGYRATGQIAIHVRFLLRPEDDAPRDECICTRMRHAPDWWYGVGCHERGNSVESVDRDSLCLCVCCGVGGHEPMQHHFSIEGAIILAFASAVYRLCSGFRFCHKRCQFADRR